ncbi:carbamoyl phosphate synthase small subunit [Virgibacillus salexigens]|uniref:carbamoyl phosphate synthase small subunit n=1 Tax=Virgibacillus salexigens TaxID=61016 RepID=UPI00190A41CB|nr:carbamoyl phosphate synthase small subunit [Virgibacillus salexigens]
MTKGYLVLETGETFTGDWIGYESEVAGEVVFNTSMTGYQEMLTDPSYAGQILTLSYPIIGNYGISSYNYESNTVQAAAVILNDVCDEPSHFESEMTLSQNLKAAAIPGLKHVDTRSLVSTIRKYQTVKGRIVLEKVFPDYIHKFNIPNSRTLVEQVSVKRPVVMGRGNCHIVLIDFGFKKSIVEALIHEHCKVTIVPNSTSYNEIEELYPDGVIISNGPGDPKDLHAHFPLIKHLSENYPTLGICLGHQLIALAFGGRTEKMPFGHRGANHPVKNLVTGKVNMTSQNHGYVVLADGINSEDFQLLFKNVNDGSVEGMKHKKLPITSVQFHPEAHPGPSDTEYIFTDFIETARLSGGKQVWESVQL